MKTPLPDIGKISPEIFDEIIYPHLGARRPEVLTGPRNGVDIAVTELGYNQVMITTTDPIFIVPPYGWERSAWFAVHILASDAVTSGFRPQYITLDLNLPLSITRDEFEIMWTTMHRECEKIGMAVISGHTGRYEGCGYPMVGGATVIAVGPADKYVTPAMARTGDDVIITKGAAIEASGLFAVTYPGKVAEAFGAEAARKAEEVFWQMSVVEDALTAVEAGVREDGVTSMHDATECGVWGGLYEVARASRVGMEIEKEQIIVQDIVSQVCGLFGIDPYKSISEGTLIITCRPHKSKEVIARLSDKNIPATVVGRVVPEERGIKLSEGGVWAALQHPRVDPFWAAFGKAASAL